jgi:mitochondrial ATPase complex subunit ATP10
MLLDRNPSNTSTISKIPIPRGERGEKFTPSPLSRPLGLPYPPQPSQNSPHSDLTWKERRDSYTDPNNVQARRRVLVRSFLRPYFQEWKRLEHWKGKSFVGPERLFKRERALWFPNLWGWTLARDGAEGRDTTPVLRGKVSLVGIQSGVWAEEQVRTFLGEKENPELKGIAEGSRGLVQKVEVNIQDHWFRALLVKMFKNNLRKSRPESEWGKYFTVRLGRDTGKGLTEDIRDAMGLLNSQVGYVYLLDTECRIRWAGSGHAWEGENKSLNAGVMKLVQEAKESKAPAKTRLVRAEVVREGDLQEEVEKALA